MADMKMLLESMKEIETTKLSGSADAVGLRQDVAALGDDPWGINESARDFEDDDDLTDAPYNDFDADYEDTLRPEDDRLGHNDPDRGNEELTERDVREVTNRIYQEMQEGIMDPMEVASAALSYMSEYDVASMANANDWFQLGDADDDDGEW